MTEYNREVFTALEDVVGKENITDDPAICNAYSKDASLTSLWRKHKKDFSTIPAYVVMPGSTEDVGRILKICNHHKIPVVPLITNISVNANPHRRCVLSR